MLTSCSSYNFYQDANYREVSASKIKVDKEVRENATAIFKIEDDRAFATKYVEYISQLPPKQKEQAYGLFIEKHFTFVSLTREYRNRRARALLDVLKELSINDDAAFRFRYNIVTDGLYRPSKDDVDVFFKSGKSDDRFSYAVDYYMKYYYNRRDINNMTNNYSMEDRDSAKYIVAMIEEDEFKTSFTRYFSEGQNFVHYFLGWEGDFYDYPSILKDSEVLNKLSTLDDFDYFDLLYKTLDKQEQNKISKFFLYHVNENETSKIETFAKLFIKNKLYKDDYFSENLVKSKIFSRLLPYVKDDLIKYSNSKGYDIRNFDSFNEQEKAGKFIVKNRFQDVEIERLKKEGRGKDFWVERMLRYGDLGNDANKLPKGPDSCISIAGRFF